MNRWLTGLMRFIEVIWGWLLALLLVGYLLSVFSVQSGLWGQSSFVFGALLALFGGLAMFRIAQVNLSDRWAMGIVLGVSVALLAWWNWYYRTVPSSDYAVLLKGARQIVAGKFSARLKAPGDYFNLYNFQIGYATYLAGILRLTGGRLLGLKIVGMLVMTATNLVLFKTLRLFFDRQMALFGALMFTVFPFVFMGAGLLNNQHEGLLLEALALYLVLKKRTWLNVLGATGLLTIAQVLRPTAVVVVLACAGAVLVEGINRGKSRQVGQAFAILIGYWLGGWLINKGFIVSGLAPVGIQGGNPYFKLLLGLTGKGVTGQPTTSATHTQLYYDLKHFDFDFAAYRNAASTQLKSLFPAGLDLQYLADKLVGFAGGIDNQYQFGNAHFVASHSVVFNALNVSGSVLYGGVLAGSLAATLRQRHAFAPIARFLPALVFGGFALAYVLIEAQPRYRYEQYYVLFLLGIPVLYAWLTRAQAWWRRVRAAETTA